jgi:hypothetical protein
MDSEAKVSGLAKNKKNFPGSFQLLESMTPLHKSTGTAGWVCNEGARISVEQPPTDPPPPQQCVPALP